MCFNFFGSKMKLLFSLGITLCFLQYVSPKVDIPAIFQKPKKKLEIPTPKTLDIREATSEEYDCVGKPDGNNANPSGDCKSFFACVKNTTYFVVCPEFPAYQTYFNPVRKLCDKSDPLACLQALEELDVKEEESEKKSVEDDVEDDNNKKDSEESNDDEESKKDEEKEEDTKSDQTGDKSSVDDNNSEETDDTEKFNSSEEDSSKEENEKDEL